MWIRGPDKVDQAGSLGQHGIQPGQGRGGQADQEGDPMGLCQVQDLLPFFKGEVQEEEAVDAGLLAGLEEGSPD